MEQQRVAINEYQEGDFVGLHDFLRHLLDTMYNAVVEEADKRHIEKCGAYVNRTTSSFLQNYYIKMNIEITNRPDAQSLREMMERAATGYQEDQINGTSSRSETDV